MSIKRTIYLQTIPPAEAVSKVKAALDRETLVRVETIPAHEASGRVLAHAVNARYSSPTFHSAAMDGYAVNARSTFSAREGHPLALTVGESCFAVNTGNPMPESCDAVIMIEQVVQQDGSILIETPAFPWQHVRRIGEDIVATELLFPRNHLLRPWDVGALLSGGIWDVPVHERLTVRIIPTGDEVLDFASKPEPGKGQVVESNSQMLAALARELGCVVERVTPVPDKPDALHQAPAHQPVPRISPVPQWKRKGKYLSTASPPCPESLLCSRCAGGVSSPERRGIRSVRWSASKNY